MSREQEEYIGNMPDTYETLEENGITAFDSGIEILQKQQESGRFRIIHACFGRVAAGDFTVRIYVEQVKNISSEGRIVSKYPRAPDTLDVLLKESGDRVATTVLTDTGNEKIQGVVHAVNLGLLAVEQATKNPEQESLYVRDFTFRRGKPRSVAWFLRLHQAIALTGKPGLVREVG